MNFVRVKSSHMWFLDKPSFSDGDKYDACVRECVVENDNMDKDLLQKTHPWNID